MEQTNEMTTSAVSAKKRGITGSTLKLIAIISMFIDHTGAMIVERMLIQTMEAEGASVINMDFMSNHASLYMADMVLRLIGRLGFPIFCFLLIEGFQYTRNVVRYATRLLIFAIISEVPFDLGFIGRPFYWGYQNVFFTLFIGLVVMAGLRYAGAKLEGKRVLCILADIAITVVGMAAAELLQTDYSAIGVLTIAVMYLCRNKRMLETGLGCTLLTISYPMEITAFAIMLPVHWYNGERGWNIKWLFYAFYPVHILLLYLIACAMGLGGVMLG